MRYTITDPNAEAENSTITLNTRDETADTAAQRIRKVMELDDCPEEIDTAIQLLAHKLIAGDYYGDEQAYLDLNIEPQADEKPEPQADPLDPIRTPLGGIVQLAPMVGWVPGSDLVQLVLRMDAPDDSRTAFIAINRDNAEALIRALQAWLNSTSTAEEN